LSLAERRTSWGVLAAFTAVVMALSLIGPFGGVASANHPPTVVENPDPATDTNPVGTTHTVNVTARGQDGQTTNWPGVRFRVTEGPNASRTGLCQVLTTADAQPPPTHACGYTSNGQAGEDTILIWADLDGSGTHSPNEPSTTATKTWTPGPGRGISISPASSSAALGTCNPFTATVTDEFGNPSPGQTVRVRQTHSNTNATPTWCQPGPGKGPNPRTPNETGTQPAGSHDRAADVGPTDDNGQVTFGIGSNTTGSVTVRVWPRNAPGSSDTDPGPASASATKTWTAGGAESVTNLSVAPASASNPTGTTHTFTMTARNAQGDPVGGVTVNGRVESGPNATTTATCTTSTSVDARPAGTCQIGYSSGTVGTDNWRFWVNQPPPPGETATPGPDPHEPQATASKTWTAPPVGHTIAVTCNPDSGHAAETDQHCRNPLTQPSETFTALVRDAQNQPASGIRVDWDIQTDNAGGRVTLNPTTCTTGADGRCSTTATNSNPQNNDNVTVRGTIAGTTTADNAQKTWEARAPQITLAPDFDTNQQGTSHTVVATVADQFGQPFAGQNVNFTVSGRNTIAPQARTTNAAGQATFTYADTAPAGPALNDTITATHTGPASPPAGAATAVKRWIPEPAVAAVLRVSMVSCDNAKTANPTRTASNPVGTTHTVWAFAQTAGGEELRGHTVDFTSTGVGRFGTATVDQGTSRTATIGANGCAVVNIYSEESGTQNVTASKDNLSDTGTKTWTALAARNIALTPASDTNPPGTTHEITATATDRFGNPVPGVALSWTRSGAGFVVSAGESPTDANGQARIVIRSDTESPPDTTVTVTITNAPHTTECARAAGDPAGAPAGNCTASATKTWADPVDPPPPDLTVRVNRAVGLGPRALRQRGVAQGFLRHLDIVVVEGSAADPRAERIRPRCFRRQRMRVQRAPLRRGAFRTIRRPATNQRGFYRAPRRIFANGRFRTVAPRRRFVAPDGTNVICARAVSRIRRRP
jgi:hypothetical protein